jgi:hypothetical protein
VALERWPSTIQTVSVIRSRLLNNHLYSIRFVPLQCHTTVLRNTLCDCFYVILVFQRSIKPCRSPGWLFVTHRWPSRRGLSSPEAL